MTEVTINVDPAPVFDLDLTQLGEILRRLPAISRRVGHNSLKATVDYVATTTPESEFVRDIFTLSSREMIDKWYGGEHNSGRYIAAVGQAALAAHRKPIADPAP
jgi:hypothetical protein